MILLSVVFITYIPNMLNAGNKTGMIEKAFSEGVKLKSGRERIEPLFILYAIKISTIAAILNKINSVTVDSGVS